MSRLAAVLSFLIGLIRDPVSKDLSSARVCGVLCVVCGCIVALTHPTDGAAVVGALIAGGGVALLTRTQA